MYASCPARPGSPFLYAADIGVAGWVAAFRPGDCVGRLIWTAPGDATRVRIAAVGPDGKAGAHIPGDRAQFCLGAGGRTHYSSTDALALAVKIGRLIAG